jgi:serine/threonine protein kinase/tetratricopeptide (TPR) repeat protein
MSSFDENNPQTPPEQFGAETYRTEAPAEKPILPGLPSGTGIGKYRILERIRTGHNCTVYKARDAMLDRLVAIKQMSPELIDSPVACGNFKREAQLLARLPKDATNVINIHELIEDEAGLFIVEEYVFGDWLETLVSKRRVGAHDALRLLRTAANGLLTLHDHQIVHRDLQPGNLLVAKGLLGKIANFASAAHEGDLSSPPMITPKYAAPELLLEQKYDDRVDIYALGMIIWEVCVGRRALNEYFSNVVAQPLAAVGKWIDWQCDFGKQLPDASELNPMVSPELSLILKQMTTKSLDHRYTAIADVLAAIAEIEPMEPIQLDALRPSQARSAQIPFVRGVAPVDAAGRHESRILAATSTGFDPAMDQTRTSTQQVGQPTPVPQASQGLQSDPYSQRTHDAHSSARLRVHGTFERGRRRPASQPVRRPPIPTPQNVREKFKRTGPKKVARAVAAALLLMSAMGGGYLVFTRYIDPTSHHPIEAVIAEAKAAYLADRLEEARTKYRNAVSMTVDNERDITIHAQAERSLRLLEARIAIENNDFELAEKHLAQAERWGAEPARIKDLKEQLWARKDAYRAASEGYSALVTGDMSTVQLSMDDYERSASIAGLDPVQFRDTMAASKQDLQYKESIRQAREGLLQMDFEATATALNDAESIRFTAETRELRRQARDTKKRLEWVQMGDDAMLEKDYASAVSAYESAGQLAPSPDIEIKTRTARAYLFLQQASEAASQGDLLTAEDKLKASLWNSETKEAQAKLSALAPAIDVARLVHNGDRAFERQGYKEALQSYETAMPKLDPAAQALVKIKMKQAQRGLLIEEGDADFRRGAFGAALKSYQRALELSPGADIEQRINRTESSLGR